MNIKHIIICSIALLIQTNVFSQDIITKLDGTEIKSKVTDILDDVIKYKKFENEEGPTYSISTSNVEKIKYANGTEDVFNKGAEKKEEQVDYAEKKEPSSFDKFDINNENSVKQVDALAKNAGSIILSKCSGKVDNSTTEIYYDQVYKDEFSKELVIPIRISWQPKNISGDRKWIRGTILVNQDGKKIWKYQNDSGIMFSGCAKSIRELN